MSRYAQTEDDFVEFMKLQGVGVNREIEMGIHNERELEEKRRAVRKASERFAAMLLSDKLTDDELLFHEVESLCQLVTEYKRG